MQFYEYMQGNLYLNCLILRSKCMNYILKVYTLCVYIDIWYMICQETYKLLFLVVQKPGPQYSPAIVVYTLHSMVMVLLYYIYLIGTYHWLLSLILSVHFRNLMLIYINYEILIYGFWLQNESCENLLHSNSWFLPWITSYLWLY